MNHLPISNWPNIPENIYLKEATSVATDSEDNVYIFNRGEIPMLVFSDDGKLIDSWGKGEYVRPHGIFIDHDDTLYLVDDGGHFLKKCTKDGKVLMTIGKPGEPSEWQKGGYFNRPTDVTIDSDGFLYISDGYGNSRIHKFDQLGNHVISWGKPGRLSTAEAIAASLIILGREPQAEKILSRLPYGNEFLSLNRNPLDSYSSSQSTEELVSMQWEYFDQPKSSDQ